MLSKQRKAHTHRDHREWLSLQEIEDTLYWQLATNFITERNKEKSVRDGVSKKNERKKIKWRLNYLRGLSLEVRLNEFILRVEVSHVDNEILKDKHVAEGCDNSGLGKITVKS